MKLSLLHLPWESTRWTAGWAIDKHLTKPLRSGHRMWKGGKQQGGLLKGCVIAKGTNQRKIWALMHSNGHYHQQAMKTRMFSLGF